MIHLSRSAWEAAAAVSLVAAATAGTVWLMRRKRPSDEDLEGARRKFLAQAGRMVDGMLLDIRELTTEDGRNLTMLEYSYRSAGVDYECSQDITTILNILDTSIVRAGFPCSVRFQTGNPQNSIVIAEGWSGIRSSLPVFPLNSRTQTDMGQFKPGRG
jgi:hypothetical protein